MKKTLSIITVFLFGIAQMAYAGGVVMSDTAMDEIAAGDWVVIQDEFANEEVVEVWKSSNDIDLQDESQMELQAVNNANAVDSAIAVQTNIARVADDQPTTTNADINGFNEADILNYNPADSSAEYESTVKDNCSKDWVTKNLDIRITIGKSESENMSGSYDETLDYVETLDIDLAYASSGEEECKGCESESDTSLTGVLDYDKTIDYDKHKTCEASSAKTCDIEGTLTMSCEDYTETNENIEKTVYKEERKNHSENNHLDLEDTSQKLLMAVSNLNSVGSGAAMQTNIASNVGMTGSITGYNNAKVVNGL